MGSPPGPGVVGSTKVAEPGDGRRASEEPGLDETIGVLRTHLLVVAGLLPGYTTTSLFTVGIV